MASTEEICEAWDEAAALLPDASATEGRLSNCAIHGGIKAVGVIYLSQDRHGVEVAGHAKAPSPEGRGRHLDLDRPQTRPGEASKDLLGAKARLWQKVVAARARRRVALGLTSS
jgi:hypothetical protein